MSAFFFLFTVLRGVYSCLAVKIAAENGLVVEAQHVGDGLNAEVAPQVQ